MKIHVRYGIVYPENPWEVNGSVEVLKLLIADACEEYRLALAEQIRGEYRVRICQEGKETLQMMLRFKPDLVVLDMMLPGLDGISILQAASDAGIHPVVLATTKFTSDYLAESAHRLGIGYLMVKPCDVKATALRLRDLKEHVILPETVQSEPRTAVSNVLLALGFSTKLRGYGYLREAILETMRCPGQMVTKELYPKVGKCYGATGTQVERSVRSAIGKAWEKREESLWRQYFQSSSDGTLERPTNSVLISVIAERMNLEQR